jgi:CelD/BcsL family acetyltransferase involved in cellulose biosynthesis
MPSRPELVAPQDVAAAWAALFARVPDATPFQHPAWLLPWWRHVAEGTPQVLALREAGDLVALFPFYRYDAERKLFPLGVATTDYLDALVAPGHEDAAMDALLGHLPAMRGTFGSAEWPQLRPGSPLLRGTAPAGWADEITPAEPCPALELPAASDGLRERVSSKTLRDLRTARRRAMEAGAEVGIASSDELEELTEALFRLHAARWATRDEAGVLAERRVQAMHRDAIPALHEAGLLRLFSLRLGGRPVGVIHALADPPGRADRTLYLYLQGFDPAAERLSPGMLLVGAAVDHAIAEGFHAVDFLRGQERYKRFWGAVDRPTFRRILTPPREEPPCAAPC